MTLSNEDIEIAAKTLCQSSGVDNWNRISGRNKEGYKIVVESIWHHVMKGGPKTPASWAVFMAWMGDDRAMEAVKRAVSDA
jgi:hypothetical protein